MLVWPLAGVLTSLLLAVVESLVRGVRARSAFALPDHFLALLHQAGLLLPIGVLCASVVGAIAFGLSRSPWSTPVRACFSKRIWFAPAPVAFASAIGGFVGVVGFVLATQRAAHHFATKYHNPVLASWAMAGAVMGLLLGALLASALVAAILLPIARRLGRIASLGVVAITLTVGLVGTLTVAILRARHVLSHYHPMSIAAWPIGAVALVVFVIGLRALGSRWSRARARAFAATIGLLGALLVAWTFTIYGESNRVRSLVEHRSPSGRELVRLYLRLTDRDGDGYSWALGGGDCDDGDAKVHPGALDEAGDGVDADCFAGDGSPNVADLGDGAFGRVPAHLSRPNILLITVDTLRADHLGSYGYERNTSPRLDRFAKEAALFDHVIAPASRSIRSIPSLLAGRYPSQLAYGSEYLYPTLLPENVTLAEVLRDRGYRTAVSMGTDYFERMEGFFQGFQSVRQSRVYRPKRNEPVDVALHELDKLQKQDGPWFLWVHIFNVHEIYLWDGTPSKFGSRPIDAYDTEITFADEEVGRLLDEVERRGLRDSTVVAITSDHGEAFGEHQNQGHCFTLYDEELKVPMLVRLPGVTPRRIDQTVALFDLFPTILNLVGAEVSAPIPARSLLPLITGEGAHPPDRAIFSELLPDGYFPYDQKAIRRGNDKLIWWVREGAFQLFDLARDPGERNDLSDDRRETAHELLGLLRTWVATTNRPEHRHENVLAENRLRRAPEKLTHPMEVRYPGRFTLLGFDVERTEYRPGDRIQLDFYYRVDERIPENLFFLVEFLPPSGIAMPDHFHGRHFPMNGRYHTSEWKPGEILRDRVEVVVPRTIRRGIELRMVLAVGAGTTHIEFDRSTPGDRRLLDLAPIKIR